MKKLILFLVFLLANLYGFSRNGILPTPNQIFSGDTMIICNESVCYGSDFNFPIPPFLGFTTNCSYYCNGVRYNTTEPYILIPAVNMIADTTIICYIDSINGLAINKVRAIVITVKSPPIISIPSDSIHHVTCPDGDFYPYRDGSFHVDLVDSIQNYAWISVHSDSDFSVTYVYYDSFTVTDLRSGTYQIEAHGTNGCIYRDSVVIIQPEAWYDDYTIKRIDTVCFGQTGCISLGYYGGTPPYSFTWFYYSDTGQVYLPDTTRLICGLYSGQFYCVYMYDSRGCKAFGEEIQYIFFNLYEYVEDSTHLLSMNPLVCYGSEPLIQAQSMGYGNYVWHVGDSVDSVNWWTWVAADSVLIADFYTPPMTESTLISVDFYDQHNCVTHDSIWVDVYNPEVSMTIETPEIVTDSNCIIHVSPLGGSLYLDGMLIVENIPNPYTLSTAGISVGEHTLKYAGTFGAELGLYCEDEVEVLFNVQSHPFVTDWDQEISIYPNPATTVLNLSSTEIMDFTICITDVTGRAIMREKILDSFYPVDVSNLTSGIYLLRLETPEGASKSMKFVKR